MYGSYICKLDNKFRFYFPAGLRKVVNITQFYLTFIDKDNLVLCDANNWTPSMLANKISESLSSEEFSKLEKWIRLNSVFVYLDSENRIQIPTDLKNRLNINDSLVLCGEGDYFSIVSKILYDHYQEEMENTLSNMLNEGKLRLNK